MDVTNLLIDCNTCVMRATDACDGCLVTALLDGGDQPVEVPTDTAAALVVLEGAGMTAPNRYTPKEGPTLRAVG